MKSTILPITAFAILALTFHAWGRDTTRAVPADFIALQQIPQAQIEEVKAALLKEGFSLPPFKALGAAQVPMGNNLNKLVLLGLDKNLNPVKREYEVHDTLLAGLAAPPDSPRVEIPVPGERPSGSETDLPQKAKGRETGRVYFVASSALRTLTIYPAAYGTLLGDEADARTITGLSLLTFGGSLYGSYRFTKNRQLGYGRVGMMNYGGELATSYSFLLSRFVYGAAKFEDQVDTLTRTIQDPNAQTASDTTEYDTVQSEIPDKIFAGGSVLGFPLGIYLGSRATLFGNYQYGNVAITRFLGRSAWLYGYLLPLYSSGDDKYKYHLASSILTMGLVPAGCYAGTRWTKDKDYSSGRSFFIETAGIMGSLSGWLLPHLFDLHLGRDLSINERRALLTSILTGHALGTTFGFKYKKQNSYSFFQGVFTAFSAVSGGALGLSIPFLAQADSAKPYIAAGVAGAWGGLIAGEYLAKSLFEETGHDRRESRLDVQIPAAFTWPLVLDHHRIETQEQEWELLKVTVRF